LAKLILKFKDQVLKEFTISEKPVVIGRLTDNFITIENVAVSKQHAKIEFKNGKHILSDLNSTNGTFVNKRKVKALELRGGDNIIIGKHTVLYEGDNSETTQGAFSDFGDATMVLNTKDQRNLLKKQQGPTDIEGLGKEAKLSVIKSNSRKEYKLTKDVTIIGKSPNSDVRIQGFLVPHMAATIKAQDDSFYISGYGGWISVLINGDHVGRNRKLNKNDVIQIRNFKIRFQI